MWINKTDFTVFEYISTSANVLYNKLTKKVSLFLTFVIDKCKYEAKKWICVLQKNAMRQSICCKVKKKYALTWACGRWRPSILAASRESCKWDSVTCGTSGLGVCRDPSWGAVRGGSCATPRRRAAVCSQRDRVTGHSAPRPRADEVPTGRLPGCSSQTKAAWREPPKEATTAEQGHKDQHGLTVRAISPDRKCQLCQDQKSSPQQVFKASSGSKWPTCARSIVAALLRVAAVTPFTQVSVMDACWALG